MSWSAPNLPHDKHCFFGAEGGVSTGKYASLNVNHKSLDKPENVTRNYEIICSRFGLSFANLSRLSQDVSADAVYIERPGFLEFKADGAVTDKPGIILSIGTADCAPVLLADYRNGVIGAAHGGWRGAFKGIVENTVALMLEKGAQIEHIAAAIGPCIQQQSFEMGAEVYELFLKQNADNDRYFIPGTREGRYMLDLSAYILDKLQTLGIVNAVDSGIDTYAEPGKYFSYRRNTHQGLIDAPADFPVELSTIIL